MTPDMQKELLARLDAIAAKLGVAADQLWRVLLRQTKIEACEFVALAVIFLVAALLGLHFARRLFTFIRGRQGQRPDAGQYGPFDYDNEGYWAGFIVVTISTIVCFAFVVSFASQAVFYFLNPQFHALLYLLSQFR